MNANTTKADRWPRAVDREKAQRSRFPSLGGDEAHDQCSLRALEDIEAPDAWTLASFADLLPQEMA